MKSLLRPYRFLGAALLGLVGTWMCVSPPHAVAQTGISRILRELNPLLSHPPGYLGVSVADVDPATAQKLGLKDSHGAIVTLIDHDAPAGSTLRVSDVVLSLNGAAIEGAEQFGRMIKEIPAGRKITLVIFRDGAQQTFTIQLVDHKEMEQKAWNNLNSDPLPPAPSGMSILNSNGDLSGWHMPLFTSSLNVGVFVEPLTAQMADYLDVPSGIMVKQVSRHSEASVAGLRPKDVILKVGGEAITTSADWDRAIRSNEGKPVQVTILRDRRQQILTLQVDSKHHRSQSVWSDIFPQDPCPQMALLESQQDPQFEFQTDLQFTQQQLDEIRRQAEQFSQEMEQFRQNFNPDQFKIDPQQMEQFRQQMNQFRQNFKPEDFRVDPKQMEELRRQMEQFHQNFNPDSFKIDPKQMQELRRQMEEFRKQFPKNFHFDRRQLDELLRELNNLGSSV